MLRAYVLGSIGDLKIVRVAICNAGGERIEPSSPKVSKDVVLGRVQRRYSSFMPFLIPPRILFICSTTSSGGALSVPTWI